MSLLALVAPFVALLCKVQCALSAVASRGLSPVSTHYKMLISGIARILRCAGKVASDLNPNFSSHLN